MELFTWSNLFWFIVLVQVFRAILDRITGYRAFKDKLAALEKAHHAQAEVNTAVNNHLTQITEQHTALINTHNTLVERVNQLSREASERRQRERAGTVRVGGAGGSVAGSGGGGGYASLNVVPARDRSHYIPGRRLLPSEASAFQVVSMNDEIATLDNGDLSFHARINADGTFTVVDLSNPPRRDGPVRPSAVPNGSGARRINLEDE